jgi:hypothetical protein
MERLKVKPEAARVVTGRILEAVREVREANRHTGLSMAELTYRVHRAVGLDHLKKVAGDNGLTMQDVLGLLAALVTGAET